MKNIFNFKLYKETFEQLKVVGSIFTVILSIIAILIPVSKFLEYKSGLENGYYSESSKIILYSGDVGSYLMIAFILAAPIITLIAFNFLTRRNSSDFYHSIPHKRGSLFTSIFAAISSWLLIVIIIPTIIMNIFFAIYSAHIAISIFELYIIALNIFIASMLCSVSIAFACTLTGTILTNVVVSGLIIFLPRILIALFSSMIVSAIPFLLELDVLFIFRNDINLITATFGNTKLLSTMGIHTFYSLLLTVIYFAITLLLFNKRKSEAAGNGAVNKVLQTVFRLCIGFVTTIPLIAIIFDLLTVNDSSPNTYSLILIFVIEILIAIIAMFLYELLSTRKVKQAIKSILTSPILVIVDGAFIVILLFIFNVSLNYTPTASDITAFSLSTSETYYYEDETSYFDEKLKSTDFKNPELIELLTTTLTSNVNEFKNNYTYDMFWFRSSVCITFKEGSKETTRILYMSDTDYNKYNTLLTSMTEYDKILTDLPDLEKSTSVISSRYLNNSQAKKIYAELQKAIASNPEPFINSFNEDTYYQTTITLETILNGKKCTAELPVLPQYQDLYKTYCEYIAENTEKDKAKVLDFLTNPDKYVYEYDELYYTFTALDNQESNTTYYNVSFSNILDYYIAVNDPKNYSAAQIEQYKNELFVPSKECLEEFKTIASLINNVSDGEEKQFIILNISASKNYSDGQGCDYSLGFYIPKDYDLSVLDSFVSDYVDKYYDGEDDIWE